MKKQLEAVKLFHETFKAPVANEPTLITDERSKLRYDLMKEENEEYQLAVVERDLVGIADALGDQLYILCGTIIEHGLGHKIEEVFDEIQRSNMSKLGEDGKPIFREDKKILKGPNYFKPNIAKILDPTPKKRIIAIAALSLNEVIGVNGELPWKQSEDLKRFKEKTLGKHIIMGRKTFESLPFLLPNRTHIVITRNKDFTVNTITPNSVLIVHSLQEAIDLCPEAQDSFIIGGGKIYKESMSVVDELELTLIHTNIEPGTDPTKIDEITVFPAAQSHMGQFKIMSRTDFKADEKNQYDYSFIRLVRK